MSKKIFKKNGSNIIYIVYHGFYEEIYYINLLKINILRVGFHWFFGCGWDKKNIFFSIYY